MLEADSFTTRLSTAIDAQELTLGRIAARLEAAGSPVSVSTLSLWRAGRVKPQRKRSMSAVEALERILRVEPGFLVSCVDEERRGPQHASERPSGIRVWAIPQDARDKILGELGDDVPTGSDVIGRHEILTLDALGRVTSVQSTLTLRITDDHAWRLIIGALSSTVYEQGRVLRLPVIHFGGSLGKIVKLRDMGLVAFEIVFDEEVHTGDVVTLSYDIAPEHLDWMPVEPDLGGDHSFQASSPLDHAILEARFHPDRIPARTYAKFWDPNREDAPKQVVDIELQGDTAIVNVDGMQRGQVTLAWDWHG